MVPRHFICDFFSKALQNLVAFFSYSAKPLYESHLTCIFSGPPASACLALLTFFRTGALPPGFGDPDAEGAAADASARKPATGPPFPSPPALG